MKIVHVIGNGDQASLYHHKQRIGMKLTCNIPPWPVPGAYGTIMVDFKMMRALNEGSLQIPGDWILGMRPKIWMDQKPTFYLKHSHQVKEFYTVLPKYVANYTDFNCGHMCTHYVANLLKCDEIHMYGFDSIFDFNLTSTTDLVLNSPRDANNTHRLAENWRPIWEGLFREFPQTQFVVHHNHEQPKISLPENVEVRTEWLSKNPQKK